MADLNINGTQYNGVEAIEVNGTMFYPDAVRYNAQNLTEAQKAQARANLDIPETSEIVRLVHESIGTPIFGVVDGSNNITLTGELSDGTYSVKYEMENGSEVNIGNLVIDTKTYYSVTKNLTYCSINNGASKVAQGESYSATISANSGYTLKTVSVTMGGAAVSVSNGKINISSVTGNIVITATAEQEVKDPTNFAEYNSTNTTDTSIWAKNHRFDSTGSPVSDTTNTDFGSPAITNFIAVQNGDIIEIITSGSSKGPSRDWLKIVKTGQARSKIRQWFKKEKRPENIEVGRAEVDKEIRRLGYNVSDDELDEILAPIAKKVGINTADDFYNTLGFGGITLQRFLPKIKDELEKLHKDDEDKTLTKEEELSKFKISGNKRTHTGGIIIDGERGCQVKFARCCNPLPGDKIVGFITRGFGVSVHKSDCPKVMESRNEENLARWVKAEWESVESASTATYEAAIQIVAEDAIGVLAAISMALADMKVSISSINTQTGKSGEVTINIVVGCRSTSHYDAIVSRLRSLSHIVSVRRSFNT